MDWLSAIRIFDIVTICLTAGIISAAILASYQKIPVFLRILTVSYLLFAMGTALEIQLAMTEGTPFSWRTILATVAALAGILATALAYFYWPRYVELSDSHE